MLLPGGEKKTLLSNSGLIEPNTTDFPWITKDNWKFKCISRDNGAGEGFIGYSPNGLKITFNKVVESNPRIIIKGDAAITKITRSILASKIEDRFGNYILYNYNDLNQLTSITSNDNREVKFTYVGDNNIQTMTYDNRVWTYTYADGSLVDVETPENQHYTYSLQEYGLKIPLAQIGGGCGFEIALPYQSFRTGEDITASVTSPNGLTATYTFRPNLRGRSNVTYEDNGSDSGLSSITSNICSANHALISKVVTGNKLEPKTWQYDYSNNLGFFTTTTMISDSAKLTGDLPSNIDELNYNKSTIISPENVTTIKYFNRDATSYFEGSLSAQRVINADGNLIEEIQNTFVKGSLVGDVLFDDNNESSNYQLLTGKKTTIRYFGEDTDSYYKVYSNHDTYGFYGTLAESNSFSSNRKYTKEAYKHDTVNWLLGLPLATSISGDNAIYQEVHRTSYYSETSNYKSLPEKQFSFGRWYKYYESYHTVLATAGLPKKVSFNGDNRWYELSEYKLGIPQKIKMPEADSSTSYQYAYNEVNDSGWVTKQTDYEGNCTNINYDGLGRMTAYIPCDEAFNATNIAYTNTSSSVKQTVTKGNYQKDTVFDSFLRPILSSEYDITNSDTVKYVSKEYDSTNNLLFISHISNESDSNKGIEYSYDGLNRISSVIDNTLSASISTEYINGNKITSTDRLNNVTTNSYLAYGTPSFELATIISSPEDVLTTTVYDILGNIISLTQGNIAESRVYDEYNQLCKIIRPEYGATAYQFDAIGQLIYEAKGNSISLSTESCDTTVSASETIMYTYDNIGRLKEVDYGDTSPDLTYTYDKNGQMLSRESAQVKESFAYNTLGLIDFESTEVDSKKFELTYGYDANGYISDMTYPNGYNIYFNPDAMGYVRGVKRESNSYATELSYASAIEYHAAGMLSSFTYGNGIVQNLDFNDRNLPIENRAYNGEESIQDHSYTYDSNDNISSYLDNRVTGYSLGLLEYDGLDRLTNIAGGSYIGNSNLEYDQIGNIKSYSSLNSKLIYNYDSSNLLTSVIGSGNESKNYSQFLYDEWGNVTDNSHRTFEYNLAGHMTKSESNEYIYNGANRRVKQVESKGTSYSLYSQAGTLFYRENTSGGTNYVYLQGKLIAKDGVGNITKEALPKPIVELTCEPSCSRVIYGNTDASFTLSLLASCGGNDCNVEWDNSNFFNIDDGESSKTFSYQCTGIFEEIASGSVTATVTDSKTGLKTIVSKPIDLLCYKTAVEPTAILECSPDSCQQTTYGAGEKSISLGLDSYCNDNNCAITWSSSNSLFSNSTDTGTRVYSYTCSGNSSYVISNKVTVTVKDNWTNEETTKSKTLTFNCFKTAEVTSASLSCSPSSCEQSTTGKGTKGITLSLATSCTYGCNVVWSSTNGFFNNDAAVNPKTYSYYCADVNKEVSGKISATVTDIKGGTSKVVSKDISFFCSASSSGGGVVL